MNTMTHTIESVSFTLAQGATTETLLEASPAITTFLKTCDGFISRRLSSDDSGNWLEYIEWESNQAAKSAMELAQKNASLAPYMQAIDIQNAKMAHGELHVSDT